MKLNCILLGECKVGKTYMLSHFKGSSTDTPLYVPTIGIDFHVYNNILRIWDTSGNKRFTSILRPFIHSSDLCIVCYNNKSTLKSVAEYIRVVKAYGTEEVSVLIVSFCEDVSLGTTLSNTTGCHFIQCNVHNKEDCVLFFDNVIKRYCKPSPNRNSCWYNWW